MTVIIGDDSDETFYSTNSVDQIDGRGGYDLWRARYADAVVPLTFTYDGHTGTLSNGTTIANIESVNFDAGSGDDTFYISGGNTVLDGEGGYNVLYLDLSQSYAGYTSLTEDYLGYDVGGADPARLHGRATTTSGTINWFQMDEVHLLLTDGDDTFGFIVGNAPTEAPMFIDGGAGDDTVVSNTTASHFTIVRDGVGGYVITAAGNDSYGYGSIDVINVEHFNGIDLEPYIGSPKDGTDGDDTLTGSDLAETMHGFGGNDSLSALGEDDRLDGGAGNDVLDGGDGIDTALYDAAARGVRVNLGVTAAQNTGGAGVDTLLHIENILGSAFGDRLVGDAAANRLEGGDGADLLNGGAGADRLEGGYGDDRYQVDDAGDAIVEAGPFGGVDQVLSTIDWTLGADIENLKLTGGAAITGVGNALRNEIAGNRAANVLDGGAGDDRLTGGRGADSFVFNDLTPQGAGDRITDFTPGADRILLAAHTFSALAANGLGPLDADAFVVGTKALTPDQHVIYDPATGALWYDPDGSGGATMAAIAVLTGHPTLAAVDISVI